MNELRNRALLLTVDTNVLGYRQSTEKVKGTRGDAEAGIRMGANESYPAYHDAKLNWDDLGWLKKLAGNTPIYLKGVCHIDVSPSRTNLPRGKLLSGSETKDDLS
jgi:L-lactate dehydrogenase (cytochrome)